MTGFLKKSGFLAIAALLSVISPVSGFAVGTTAGTDISNTASVNYELAGTPVTQQSNTVVITVAETLDVAVVLQSPQRTVSGGDTNVGLLFTVTNTGNGNEVFVLSVDNTDPADDFDPLAATPSIYFDTDGSGDLSVGDQPYTPGTNDPLLAPDASVAIIVLNDIPTGLNNGDVGRSALVAASATGTGAPGTLFAGQGDNGVDAVTGTTTALQQASGEYIVSDVTLNALKASTVIDPFGGNSPVPGATIRYTITVSVTGTGTAAAAVFNDAIPANTNYTDNSLSLNAAALSDQVDGDAGELDTSGAVPAVIVRLGDLTEADGDQIIIFEVVID
ncbi:MAG: hypothetical protein AAGA84_01050 [Pseudomonadota bacterium]